MCKVKTITHCHDKPDESVPSALPLRGAADAQHCGKGSEVAALGKSWDTSLWISLISVEGHEFSYVQKEQGFDMIT